MVYSLTSASERRTLPPAIAVSTVAFAITPPADANIGDTSDVGDGSPGARRTTLWIPLVRRTREPYAGRWALPGGPTEWYETLTDTALRSLTSSVLREPGYLEQLYAFGGVERSAQAQRLVTIAYWAQYGEHELSAPPVRPALPAPEAAVNEARGRWDDPRPTPAPSPGATPAVPDPNVAWFSADRLPELAFDHAEIIDYALWRLRVKTEYSQVAHRFLGSEFTLAQLRRVHEAILGHEVDPANFRRQSLASGHLVDTGTVTSGTAHRPARLYRFSAESPAGTGSTSSPSSRP